jgi:hypothetical protein
MKMTHLAMVALVAGLGLGCAGGEGAADRAEDAASRAEAAASRAEAAAGRVEAAASRAERAASRASTQMGDRLYK